MGRHLGGGQRNVGRHLGGGSEKCVTSFGGGQRFVTLCDRGGGVKNRQK